VLSNNLFDRHAQVSFHASNAGAEERLLLCSSYQRPGVLLLEMIKEPMPANRLKLFLDYWTVCDAPWPHCAGFKRELRAALAQVRLADVLPPAEREWYANLPLVLDVWRGCELGRERGLSWTTDIAVAKAFARGKRCINRVPTLVHARIPKQHIFGVFLDRRESEIALDPRRVRRVRAEQVS
jgi:hypothetical protein